MDNQHDSETQAANRSKPGHPLALAVYYQVRDRSPQDIRFIYEAARRRAGDVRHSERQSLAAGAIFTFLDARTAAQREAGDGQAPAWAAGEPTGRRYRMFREARPNPKDLPSEQFIINSFGRTWNGALEAVGVRPAVDVSAMRLTARGPEFSRDELKDVLRFFARHVDGTEGENVALTVTVYENFAALENARQGGMRMPGVTTIVGRFGSWPAALQAVGMLHRSRVALRTPSERVEWGLDDLPSARPPEEGIDIQLIRWLLTHLSPEEAQLLTGKRYDRLRLDAEGEAARNQILIEIPSSKALTRDYGSWGDALRALGITPKRAGKRRRTPYSRADAERALVRAARDTRTSAHQPLSVNRYREWREMLRREDPDRQIPADHQIRLLLGDGRWATALDRILGYGG